MNGFTLIEIMVALLICVGLVALMTTLYRSVGKSAIALRGGQQEWKMQQQVREQLLHLFPLKSTALPTIAGRSAEIYFTGWQSGATALDGKPVLGYYHYAANERVLYYQEQPLPPWWQGVKSTFDLSSMQSDVRAAPPRKMLTGVESLAFVYLQKGATDMHAEHWAHEWQDPEAPKLIQMQFSKAGRNYTILFETRGTDAEGNIQINMQSSSGWPYIFNVKLAQRALVPLALRERAGEITSHLVAVLWQPSGMASSSIRETGIAGFIIKGGTFAMTVPLQRTASAAWISCDRG